jgi:hypothetical protein
MLVGVVGLAAALSAAAPAKGATSPFVTLNAARLGMSLQAWRALPPAGAAPGAPPSCAAQPSARIVTCTYASKVGRYVLPNAVPLDRTYQATDIRYVFDGGRLSEVAFRSSVDAYNDLTAVLDKDYGPPTRTAQDQVRSEIGPLRRVRQAWTTPTAQVLLVDPSADPTKLGVTILLKGAAPSPTLAHLPG